MSSLVDFNISTPRNRTQSSNECGVVINNHVSNCSRSPVCPVVDKKQKRLSVNYPDFNNLTTRDIPQEESLAPSVIPQDENDLRNNIEDLNLRNNLTSYEEVIYLNEKVALLTKELDFNKEIALTFSKILKDNNKKLLANIIDQSNKIIVDQVSLCMIISKLLDIPVEYIHLEYVVHTEGCLSKALKIADIQDIKINHIDFRLGYNEKYNILLSNYSISLPRVLI
jgi:hypothetical protein